MAASSFVLCLSLVLLVTTLGCSAQLGHKEPSLIPTLQGISNSTVESLRLLRQNTGALSDLHALLSLPDMLQLVKEQITLEMERNRESVKKELAGLKREAENAHQIQDLKSWFEGRDEKVDTCIQESQSIKQKYEEERKKVEQLTESNAEITKKIADINVQVQDLNTRLQESALLVQELGSTVMKLNQTCKKEEVDQDTECRQPQLQKTKEVVQRFKSSKDLSQLRADLESVMDSSSAEFQQLQSLQHDDFFTYRLGYSGHTQLATLLLCAGLPIDTAVGDGNNMLHGAAYSGEVQLVRLLLQHGAKLDARGGGQYTALIWAANKGHLEVVKLLVEAGASTTARNQEGRTALEAARYKSRTAVVQYLQRLQH